MILGDGAGSLEWLRGIDFGRVIGCNQLSFVGWRASNSGLAGVREGRCPPPAPSLAPFWEETGCESAAHAQLSTLSRGGPPCCHRCLITELLLGDTAPLPPLCCPPGSRVFRFRRSRFPPGWPRTARPVRGGGPEGHGAGRSVEARGARGGEAGGGLGGHGAGRPVLGSPPEGEAPP